MIWDVNWWAVILATLSTIIVGSVWYTPKAFGNYWMRVARVDPGDRNPVGPITATIVVSLVSAWVLAVAVNAGWSALGGSYLLASLGTAALLWAGFTAARFITHDAFEGRPAGLTILNVSHELVTFVVMALIIGVWPPAGTV
jgi:hypothetical protein